jgi:hypothetical protein
MLESLEAEACQLDSENKDIFYWLIGMSRD